MNHLLVHHHWTQLSSILNKEKLKKSSSVSWTPTSSIQLTEETKLFLPGLHIVGERSLMETKGLLSQRVAGSDPWIVCFLQTVQAIRASPRWSYTAGSWLRSAMNTASPLEFFHPAEKKQTRLSSTGPGPMLESSSADGTYAVLGAEAGAVHHQQLDHLESVYPHSIVHWCVSVLQADTKTTRNVKYTAKTQNPIE